MSTLGFPVYASGTNIGATYTLGSVTYRWNGYAWYKTNQGTVAATTVTAGTIVVGTGSSTVIINGGSITINGGSVLTTSSLISSLSSGTDISVYYNTSTAKVVFDNISTLQTVSDRGSTTTNIITFSNTTNSFGTDTGAIVISGGVGIGGDVWAYGRVNAESIMIADTVLDSTLTPVTSAIAPVVIDSYPVTQFRCSKYLVQVDDSNNGSFMASELLLLVVNTGTNYSTSLSEYGTVFNIPGASPGYNAIGEFQHQIFDNAGDLYAQLLFQAYGSSYKTVKVLRTAMTP
jgi:uncharacterized Zn-binding protein involved in type VI secretion